MVSVVYMCIYSKYVYVYRNIYVYMYKGVILYKATYFT